MPKMGMEPKRRADVLNATLACISEYGIEGMTLDKVAEYAGCSKGVVAYYYKNKDHLTVEAFKAFLAYYGLKIESELNPAMSAGDMLGVTLQHILPPYREETERGINVSPLEGVERMAIPHNDQARLFLQFFSKAMLDQRLQEVLTESYTADLQGIAKILDYGNRTGEMAVTDTPSAAYGLLAMVVGLSFFRVAGFQLTPGQDNRHICEEYVRGWARDSTKWKGGGA